MSVPVSATISQNAKPKVIRKTANFQPSIWGDQFVTYTSDDAITHAHKEKQVEELKEEVRRELMTRVDQPSKQLKFIDAIQRLGVAYHFDREIEEALQHIYDDRLDNGDEDLYNVSLWFRLLRQEGYNVSSDILYKFKNDEGNFKESLIGDVQGMLGLYEATHLRIHGEDVLDEALAFTTIHLESMATSRASDPLMAQVIHALKQPIRKGLPRLEAGRFISIYQEDGSHNEALLKLAKLDFNLLQSLHRKELSEIARWWKDLDFARKLPYVRDRVVECFFWILGVYFEPQYSLARRILTKVISMTSVIDDIYDAYGTFEELELFTEAIERWDINFLDQLPEYMKFVYQALLDVYAEIEEEMSKQARAYRVHYAKEAMKNLVQVYFVEAKWFNEGYIPPMEEYMPVALLSCGYPMLITASFVGMGEVVTKEAFDWVFNNPKIVKASSIINRLMDDIVSHQFEQERGHVASGVECYMKQYGASKQEVFDEFNKQVVNAWKDINEEFLRPTDVPFPLLLRALNFARVMDVLYKDKDGYTHVGKTTKDRIASLLIDPVAI
uniref:TPS02 n=1 Tax=Liquidambar formosana TaxID=63359 RepID=A0A1L1WGF5_LIQFO|nr:TPS02 [Liquidambar formosana]AMD82310.1 trans-beta-guaiene synthase [Liquidambar formosana]